MTTRAYRIEQILTQAFTPTQLIIQDDSAKHASHKERNNLGADGETHFHLTLISNHFKELSRVERSRAVHEKLEDEFKSGLHALSLTLRTAEEESKAVS